MSSECHLLVVSSDSSSVESSSVSSSSSGLESSSVSSSSGSLELSVGLSVVDVAKLLKSELFPWLHVCLNNEVLLGTWICHDVSVMSSLEADNSSSVVDDSEVFPSPDVVLDVDS